MVEAMLRVMLCAITVLAFSLSIALPLNAQAGLRLLTEITPPAQFFEDGKLTGRVVELMREAMSRLDQDIPFEVLPWARAYQMALSGPNVGLFGTTRTAEREELFKWAGPLTRLKWVFYTKSGSNLRIQSLEDARKVRRIGTYCQDAREQFLLQQGFTNLESVNNQETNMRKLVMGRLDLVAGTSLGLRGIIHQAGIAPGEVEEAFAFRTMDLYLAFSWDVPDQVVASWNHAFESMHEDGTFRRIYHEWQPGAELPPPPSRTPGAIMSRR